MNCVFCKIIKGEIPANKLYEDDNMIIIKDINPQSAIHLLAIPKEHYPNIKVMSSEQAIILGNCIRKIGELAEELGLEKGFRIVSNCGEYGCQSENHLHIHILGGEQLSAKMS